MLEADVEADRREFTVRARLAVAPAERLALFGPSGAGKTTLLEVIAGLIAPRRARISLNGRVLTATERPPVAVPPWRRKVGLLRQDPGLFPHLSVRDNLLYSRSGPEAEAELAGLAGQLGIGTLLAAMPSRLSGGQAHRVALGRLLLSHCDALLLDEPYTGLDASLRRGLTELVVALVGQRQVPAVLVAHELAEAQAFADRLAVLDRGEVLQAGRPDQVVRRPASRRVAELVGYTSFVPVAAGAGRVAAGRVPAGPGAGPVPAAAVAGIHPDRVVAGAQPGRGLVLTGVVGACRPSGALWEVGVLVGGQTVTGRLGEAAGLGTEITVTAVDPPVFLAGGAAAARDAMVSSRSETGSD